MSLPNLPCIANGHNNASGLTPLAFLNQPLFRRHIGRSVKVEWHSYVGRAPNGKKALKTWGTPYLLWIFGVMYRVERLYLDTHFGDEVTIRVYNEQTMNWANYNGIMQPPELGALQRRQGKWFNATYTFVDLVAI